MKEMEHGYYIETFGCQMNVRDSETIAGLLAQCGCGGPCSKENADVIVYNTCCVRDHAEKRVFGNIGMLESRKAENPRLIIAVCGCMMQQRNVAQKLYQRFPFVDIVFGTNLLSRLPGFIDEARMGNRVLAVQDSVIIEDDLPAVRSGSVNAFVNINYGCNNFCTYCIVPYVRGRERSRKPEAVVDEARALAASGLSEITLLGQNVNSYGNDLGDTDFAGLLEQVSKVDGLKRIRFMTSHPKDLSDRLIEAIALHEKVCHHVHLPVQSGSNRILAAMNRRYTREQYFTIADKLRAAMDDVELTTDLIVGFPGETESDFCDTLELVERVGFAAAFTFQYSPRRGTAAAVMPEQVPDAEKRERLKRLNALQERMSRINNERYIGAHGVVHVEGCDLRSTPLCYGKLSNFKMVYFPGKPALLDAYVPVDVQGVRKNSLIGTMEETTC